MSPDKFPRLPRTVCERHTYRIAGQVLALEPPDVVSTVELEDILSYMGF